MSSLSLISYIDGEACGDASALGYFGIPIWSILVIFFTIGQFVLCEEYFVPTLSALGERLKMPQDVQGATLLAIGTSAPELYTAILGVIFYPNENPGPATNVGSAVFNMCIIIGLCALVAPIKAPAADRIPFFRDSISYLISLLLLYVFYSFNTPQIVELWEAIILISWWIVYVVVVIKTNKWIESKLTDMKNMDAIVRSESDTFIEKNEDKNKAAVILHDIKSEKKEIIAVQFDDKAGSNAEEANEDKDKNSETIVDVSQQNVHLIVSKKKKKEIDAEVLEDNLHELLDDLDDNQRKDVNKGDMIVAKPSISHKKEEENEINLSCCMSSKLKSGFIYVRRKTMMEQQNENNDNVNCIHSTLKKLCKAWTKLFHYVLPKKDGSFASKHVYLTIFFINVWLAILTFILIDAAVKIGHCFNMSADLIGLTLLAIGSSIPDCIASVLVAKQQKIDMAISTALSSNIFDISLCVGISFVLGAIINSAAEQKASIPSEDDMFGWLIFAALIMLLMLWPMMICSKMKLNKFIGITLIFMYTVFLCLFTVLFIM